MQVYKGRWNGVLVAVKVLNAAAAEVVEDFQRECAILERLRHPNIIKYFGTASNAEGQVSIRPGVMVILGFRDFEGPCVPILSARALL